MKNDKQILFHVFMLTNRRLYLGLMIIMIIRHFISQSDRIFHTTNNPKSSYLLSKLGLFGLLTYEKFYHSVIWNVW